MTISVSGVQNIGAQTFYGSGQPNGVYDLTATGDLVVQGQVWIQSQLANDTVIGIHTEGSIGTPTLQIVHGSGEIDVTALGAGSSAYGFYSGSAPVSFTDDWAFTVNALAVATGACLGAGGSFSNTDEFAVMAGTGVATGVFSAAAAAISNTGYVQVTSSASDGYGFNLTHFGGSTLTNGGDITIYAYSGTGYGVVLADPDGGTATVSNTGTISANVSILVKGSLNLALLNSGSINGAITLADGPGSTITNTGHINGVVTLGASGADSFDGRGGTLTGALVLGGGTDTVHLGDEGETVYGGTGASTVVGGAGADHIIAGASNEILTGGGGADTFVFRTPSGAATITDFSDAAGDKLDLTALGMENLASVLANATLINGNTVIHAGGLAITLTGVTSLQASDFVFGQIKVAAIDHITIDASITINSTARPLVEFTGSSGGVAVNNGSMIVTSSPSDSAVGVNTDYSQDPTALFENHGSFSVTGDGAWGVVNATLHNSGTFTVTSGFFPAYGAMGEVINSGSMTVQGGGNTYGVNDGVSGNNLGTFSNLAPGILSVTSSAGAAFGVSLTYGNTFRNDGALRVSAVTAAKGVVFNASGATNTVSNTGTIAASGDTGIGVDYTVGGFANSIVNSGSITAAGATSSVGISLSSFSSVASATLQNSGTITAQTGVAGGNLNLTFTNSGTVNGAVKLGNGVNVLDSHAGAINGVVSLGTGTDTVTLGDEDNTVSLAGGMHLIDGGGGINSISYASASSAVSVNLGAQGVAQNTGVGADTLFNFQALIGSAFNDTLVASSGSSTLTGGEGADTFVVAASSATTTVTDFSHAQGDKIDLSRTSAAFSLADVLAEARQVGSDTVISIGSGSLTLKNVSVANLSAADFKFGLGPTVGPNAGGTPQAGSGTLTGGAGDDWLVGQGGADTLHGGAGSDYLDGGPGLNTATYDGTYRQYVVAPNAAAVTGGPEGGSDFLAHIQRIQFVDGYLATGTTDTAGEVYRVYEATLGRAPDPEGLADWVHALNAGGSLQSVVNGFVNSVEFQQTYGALDNAGFVKLLYHNVLGRDPDDGGLASWVGQLDAGASRAGVVTGFSESGEFIDKTAAPVQQGLWIQDTAAAEVARLYDAVFGRLPDAGGLADWTHNLEGGMSLQNVANGFVGAPEFQATYGSLDNKGFVTLLYQNVLGRLPDDAGLANWVGQLNAGTSRAQVVIGFSESGEHIQNTAPHVDYGIWLA